MVALWPRNETREESSESTNRVSPPLPRIRAQSTPTLRDRGHRSSPPDTEQMVLQMALVELAPAPPFFLSRGPTGGRWSAQLEKFTPPSGVSCRRPLAATFFADCWNRAARWWPNGSSTRSLCIFRLDYRPGHHHHLQRHQLAERAGNDLVRLRRPTPTWSRPLFPHRRQTHEPDHVKPRRWGKEWYIWGMAHKQSHCAS